MHALTCILAMADLTLQQQKLTVTMGPKSLKYLLSKPLLKKFANTCSRILQ
jgi:hypothetical protein